MKRFQRDPTLESRRRETGDLIRLAQEGERPALEALFGRYRPAVLDFARRRIGARLRLREDPEDLTQTTFREATRDFPRYEYRGERSFLNWLTQILQNKIRDKAEFHKAAKRDVSRETGFTLRRPKDEPQVVFEPPSRDLSTTHILQREEEAEILHEHLETLDELPRRAIELVYFQGLSLREAGERLGGRSEDAVRMLIRRAGLRIRDRLARALHLAETSFPD